MKTLKYAWRFLMRSKSYTIINLLGLAFSLACSIILMRYIHRELTVDAHSVDPEHIIIPIRDIEGNLHPGSLQQGWSETDPVLSSVQQTQEALEKSGSGSDTDSQTARSEERNVP